MTDVDSLATLRQRIAGELHADALADAVLAAIAPELERLRKAERAVDLLAGAHRRADEAEAQVKRLSDLVDRLGQTERQQRDTLARVRQVATDLSTWLAPDGIDAQATAASILAALDSHPGEAR